MGIIGRTQSGSATTVSVELVLGDLRFESDDDLRGLGHLSLGSLEHLRNLLLLAVKLLLVEGVSAEGVLELAEPALLLADDVAEVVEAVGVDEENLHHSHHLLEAINALHGHVLMHLAAAASRRLLLGLEGLQA